jgi:hypothetical protein
MRAKPRRDREADHGQTVRLRTGLAGSHKQYHVIGVTDGASQPAVKYLIGLAASLVPISRVLQVLFGTGDHIQALHQILSNDQARTHHWCKSAGMDLTRNTCSTVVVDLDCAAYSRHNQVDGRLWSG